MGFAERESYGTWGATMFTQKQQAIIRHEAGPAVVIAGPGSGKTATMVEYTHTLVRRGVSPEKILLTVFSTEAVREIAHRLQGVRTNIKTNHVVGCDILRRARELNLYAPKVRAVSASVIANALGGLTDEALKYIALQKARARAPGTKRPLEPSPHQDDFVRFEEKRNAMRFLTFDDMLTDALNLLEQHGGLRAEVQGWYEHVVVDEFQDSNDAQVELLHHLTRQVQSYVVIGDSDQSIFTFRGANGQHLLDFAGRYNAKRYLLEDNFRSYGEITTFANFVIGKAQGRFHKQVLPARSFGGAVSLHATEDVAHAVHEALEHFAPQDTAVLVRFFSQTPDLEVQLINDKVGYYLQGSKPFYDLPECKKILALLGYKVLQTSAAFARSRQGIPFAKKVREGLGNIGPHEADWHCADFTLESEAHQVLTSLAATLQLSSDAVAGLLKMAQGSVGTFVKRVLTWHRNRVGRDRDGLLITSVHRAKGLEWECVIVPEVNEGVYPSPNSDDAEELRLLYVALTRARRTVHVQFDSAKRSRFLEGAEKIQQDGLELGSLLAKNRRTKRESLRLHELIDSFHLTGFLEQWRSTNDIPEEATSAKTAWRWFW